MVNVLSARYASAAMNEVWSAWLPEGQAPARATVEAPMAHPKIKVEIMVEAAVG